MEELIVKIAEQIGNPYLMFSLVVILIMYRLLVKKEEINARLSDGLHKVLVSLEGQSKLLEILIGKL